MSILKKPKKELGDRLDDLNKRHEEESSIVKQQQQELDERLRRLREARRSETRPRTTKKKRQAR